MPWRAMPLKQHDVAILPSKTESNHCPLGKVRRTQPSTPKTVLTWVFPAIPNYPFFGLAGRHFVPLLSLNPELKADFPF
jgi:hypothetical protein